MLFLNPRAAWGWLQGKGDVIGSDIAVSVTGIAGPTGDSLVNQLVWFVILPVITLMQYGS